MGENMRRGSISPAGEVRKDDERNGNIGIPAAIK